MAILDGKFSPNQSHLQFSSNIANKKLESRITNNRIIIFIAIVLIIFIALGSRIIYLQVLSHSYYLGISNKNHISKYPIAPNRGRILDKHNILVATNKSIVNLYVKTKYIKNNRNNLNRLPKLINIDKNQLKKMLDGANKRKKFLLLKNNLTEKEEATILVNLHLFPSLEIKHNAQRHYVQNSLFAHYIGYVGRISQKEWKNLDKKSYQLSYLIGKTGIEKTYEKYLKGSSGLSSVEVNAYGSMLRQVDVDLPENGTNLTLHMDYSLQQKAAELLKDKVGCVVALDPNTGGVLAMVSSPSFNVDFFINGITNTDYQALRVDKQKPLFNRCLAGLYPPASLIKPFIALSALEQKVITPKYSIQDKGWYQLKNNKRKYRNWKRSGHGKVNLHKALLVSNDTYFYDLSYRMTIDGIHLGLKDFGFGRKTVLDASNEKTPLLPSSKWKSKTHKSKWFVGDTINIGIGQGYIITSPIQLAYATTILANRGKRILPRFIWKLGRKEKEWENQGKLPPLIFKQENIDFIINAMHDVMHTSEGTGYYYAGRLSKYKIAGKTGTAQVVGIKQNETYDATKIKLIHLDHALFLGFAPIQNPQIVVTILIENGGSGGKFAAPIGTKLINHYLDCQKNRNQPKCQIK